MTYTYFWPPESEPPDYKPVNYDCHLGVNRDPSWQTRGLPDRPSVWPVGIYWDKLSERKTINVSKELLALLKQLTGAGDLLE